jgi:hypothetical protein
MIGARDPLRRLIAVLGPAERLTTRDREGRARHCNNRAVRKLGKRPCNGVNELAAVLQAFAMQYHVHGGGGRGLSRRLDGRSGKARVLCGAALNTTSWST